MLLVNIDPKSSRELDVKVVESTSKYSYCARFQSVGFGCGNCLSMLYPTSSYIFIGPWKTDERNESLFL